MYGRDNSVISLLVPYINIPCILKTVFKIQSFSYYFGAYYLKGFKANSTRLLISFACPQDKVTLQDCYLRHFVLFAAHVFTQNCIRLSELNWVFIEVWDIMNFTLISSWYCISQGEKCVCLPICACVYIDLFGKTYMDLCCRQSDYPCV